MRLCSKLAHISLDFLTNNPETKNQVDSFFKTAQGRFGYHGSQLAEKHKLPMVLAARMSAYMNLWLQYLDALKDQLPAQLWDRLSRCTRSFSSLANRPFTCRTKLCPWCRALKVIQVQAILAASQAQGCTITMFPVHGVVKVPRTPPRASLTIKNLIRSGSELTVKLVCVYPEKTATMDYVKKGIVADILGYDFGMLGAGWLPLYLELGRDLNMFTRKTKK